MNDIGYPCSTRRIGEVTLQSVILGLTFLRHFAAIRAGWARTPLVSLLCRDGATAFTTIVGAYPAQSPGYRNPNFGAGVLISTIVYARFEYIHDSAHAVFP